MTFLSDSARIDIQAYVLDFCKDNDINLTCCNDDIEKIIFDIGYFLKYEPLEENVFAYTQHIGNYQYEIVLNTNTLYCTNFKRFCIAHELGHIIIPKHNKILMNGNKLVSSKDNIIDNEIEAEADYFAVSLLAPHKRFIEFIKNLGCNKQSIESISEYFGLSLHSSAIRFIEKTKLTCSMILINKDKVVDSEYRSKSMYENSKGVRSIRKNGVDILSLAYGFLDNQNSVTSKEIPVNIWYSELNDEISAQESIVPLSYCNKTIILLEPNDDEISNYIED